MSVGIGRDLIKVNADSYDIVSLYWEVCTSGTALLLLLLMGTQPHFNIWLLLGMQLSALGRHEWRFLQWRASACSGRRLHQHPYVQLALAEAHGWRAPVIAGCAAGQNASSIFARCEAQTLTIESPTLLATEHQLVSLDDSVSASNDGWHH